jgi:hypothetical protein
MHAAPRRSEAATAASSERRLWFEYQMLGYCHPFLRLQISPTAAHFRSNQSARDGDIRVKDKMKL